MPVAALPLVAPVDVLPSPVPVQAAVARVTGQELVAMQIATPLGVQVYFFSLDFAKRLGAMLTEAGSGLVLATALPP